MPNLQQPPCLVLRAKPPPKAMPKMPCTAETEPRIVYASLLSELRSDVNLLKKADVTMQKTLEAHRQELRQLRLDLQELKEKLQSINVMVKVAGLSSIEIELPDNLRLTYNTLRKLVVADAQRVADITKRARAVESAYLNQLLRMNVVSAERRGRTKKFTAINHATSREAICRDGFCPKRL